MLVPESMPLPFIGVHISSVNTSHTLKLTSTTTLFSKIKNISNSWYTVFLVFKSSPILKTFLLCLIRETKRLLSLSYIPFTAKSKSDC